MVELAASPERRRGTSRLRRHRHEIARIGWRDWAWSNLVWWLADRRGLRLTRVGITLLTAPATPGPAPRFRHCLADEPMVLASADTPGLARPTSELRARLARGDLCFASFEGERLVAFNWYSRSPSPLTAGVACQHPADIVVSHDTVVVPDRRGQGLAAESWRTSHAMLAAMGVRGILVFVNAENLSSIRALAKDPRLAWVGYAVAAGKGPVRRAWLSAGCRRRGIAAIPAPPVTPRAP